jgi:ABC-2 type transport system ATP-binding protein
MLVLEEVRKSYAEFPAVKSVSFTVARGEILGLLGPNGAGKTTLMRILTGYHFPSAGRVTIDGLDLYDDAEQIRSIIGYLPENAPLYPELSVHEFLSFAAESRGIASGIRDEAIGRAVASCSLQTVYHRPISQLSKGFRQRVALAQAILHDPKILILDEPTSGLDPNQIGEIRQLIRDLGREKTIILSTHIMQEVEALCDRVVILHEGRVVGEGDTGSIGRELRGGEGWYVRFDRITHEEIDSLVSAGAKVVRPSGTGYEIFCDDDAPEDLIFDWCVQNGIRLRELRPIRFSLEDVFLKLTATGSRENGDDGAGEVDHEA